MSEAGAAAVRVPKLNANDTIYTLVEWLVPDGGKVSAGSPVAVVETSKATQELATDYPGFLRVLLPAGSECRAGQVIAQIFDNDVQRPATTPAVAVEDSMPGSGVVVTAPAQALLEQHGLDLAAVQVPGRRVVRRQDVEELLTNSGAPPAQRRLPPLQQAVGAVVTESHRNVPAAFVAVKAHVDEALTLARRLSKAHRCLIGMPELVTKAVAAQHTEFPLCFARLLDPATVRLSAVAHVGVTVDVGGGLQVPVVHHAARLDWHELSTTMMGFRTTAIRGGFHPDELSGGNIVIALHNDQDVTLAIPLVYPGQVCAVSLAATQPELALAPDGEVSVRHVVQLGLAYDHRVINGADAVSFLLALKRLLSAPERLAVLGEHPAPA